MNKLNSKEVLWILQDGFYEEDGYVRFCNAMDRMSSDYIFIDVLNGELEEIGSFTITSPEGKQKTFPLEPLDEEHIIENIHCNLIKFAAILYD